MEKFRFSATVGWLALGMWLASSSWAGMSAQKFSPAFSAKLAQSQPQSSDPPRPDADSSTNEFKPSITLSPISPACPFPSISVSKAVFNTLFGEIGEITFDPKETDIIAVEQGDGSDADLGSTVSDLVIKKKLDEALQVAQKIKDISQKNEALNTIVTAFKEAGQLERAFEVAKMMTEPPESDNASSNDNISWKYNALLGIAIAYVETGQLDNALQVVQIMAEGSKVDILLDIAQKYGEAGQPTRAAEAIDRAVADYRTRAKSNSTDPVVATFWKLLSLSGFASQYAAVGRNNRAAELSSEIFELVKTLPQQNAMTLGLLSSTVESYALAGQKDKAAEVLSYSLDAAKNIKETFAKAFALAGIANGYAAWKQPDRAIELLSQALDLAKSENGVSEKNVALVAIARTYGVLGQYDKALHVTDAVEPASLRDRVKQTLTCSQKQPSSVQPKSHLQ